MTRETGVIFSGDHPAKILAGTKTQTRRAYGLEAVNKNPNKWRCEGQDKNYLSNWLFTPTTGYDKALVLRCPYGSAGDLLWMKEIWRVISGYSYYDLNSVRDTSHYHSLFIAYRDGSDREIKCSEKIYREYVGKEKYHRWQSPMLMPRIFSRANLRIADLYPQRLLNLTPQDAIAEGVEGNGISWQNYSSPGSFLPTAWDSYISLWNNINRKRPELNAGSNPWVWKIEFELI